MFPFQEDTAYLLQDIWGGTQRSLLDRSPEHPIGQTVPGEEGADQDDAIENDAGSWELVRHLFDGVRQ